MALPVIVTRPKHQADGIMAALRGRGFHPVAAPCLELEIAAGPSLNLAGVAAIAVTSANGVAALAGRTQDRAIRLLAVGEATARAAAQHGFVDVDVAGGMVDTMVAALMRRPPGPGTVLHIAGEDVAGDLVGALRAQGIDAQRITLYRMQPASALPDPAASLLRRGEPAVALLMSPRTAQIFAALARAAAGPTALRSVTAACLSPAIAAAAMKHGFAAVAAAGTPDTPALLDLLEGLKGRL